MPRPRRSRAIATIIGGVLLAIALLAILALYFYLNTQQKEILNTVSQAAQERISTQLLASSLQGYYTYNYFTGTLTITITSNAPRAVTITSIDILWDNQTTLAIDRYTELGTTITATITSATGTTTTVNSFPVTMAPGDTLEVTINQATQPITVSATLSASPAVAVITIKNYYQLYPNMSLVSSNVSIITSNYTLLASIASDWTKTWRGTITAYVTAANSSKVLKYTIPIGISISGNNVSLAYLDGDVLQVITNKSIIVSDFKIVVNNTIYATDFDKENVFTSGTWNTVGGTWTWAPGIGYDNTAGINQTNSACSDGVADGSECIAFPSELALFTNQSYYVMAHISPLDGQTDSWHDIVLYNESSNGLYEFSIYYGSSGSDIEIWIYNGRRWVNSGYPVNSTPVPITLGQWYTSLVYFDPVNRISYFTVILPNGSSYNVKLPSNYISFNVSIAAVGTYYAEARFDDFIVSRANPRYLNISVMLDGSPVSSGWRVEVYNGSGYLVASGTTDDNGLAVLDVVRQPVIDNAYIKVYNSSGDLVAVFWVYGYLGKGWLYGGNLYEIDLATGYSAIIKSYAVIPSGVNVLSITAFYDLSCNETGTYVLAVYNWTSSSWIPVAVLSLSGGTQLSYSKSFSVVADIINPTNNTVLLEINYTTTAGPASLSIDRLNANYTYLYNDAFTGLLVAVGGRSKIDLYRDTGTGLIYEYSIDPHTVFNGSATITYDIYTNTLLLVNATGIYAAKLQGPDTTFTQVTQSCVGLAGVEAEAINTSSKSYLVVLEGGGSDNYCIVDLSENTTTVGRLSESLGSTIVLDPSLVYPASTGDWIGGSAYFLVYDNDTGTPIVVMTNSAQPGTWSMYSVNVPGSHVVGLTGYENTLYLLLEHGGLYILNGNETDVIQGIISFNPMGPGDRLEYVNATTLLFIRADNTRETYLVRIG